jgi:acylphosphatase
MMKELAALRTVVSGRVQGVLFRAFVQERATELGLIGSVRNLPSGDAVEVIAEGERGKLLELLGLLKAGPPGSIVANTTSSWSTPTGRYSGFRIIYQ